MGVPSVAFKAYSKSLGAKDSKTPNPSTHSLLLQSSQHPKLDFTAEVGPSDHLDHYIGVYDPATSSLKIVPAHAVTIRSTLRSEAAEVKAQNSSRTYAKQREELGMEFGTKKAKKALLSKTVNAIGGSAGKGVEAAVLDSVKEATDALPVKEEQQDSILASKPIPHPNLEAQKIEDVYRITTLVPPGDMRALAVKEWQDAVKSNTEVKLSSRFIANRLQAVVARDDVQALKALKYLHLLLEFNSALAIGRGGGKKVPMKEKLREKMAAWPETLIENVRRRFAEGGYV